MAHRLLFARPVAPLVITLNLLTACSARESQGDAIEGLVDSAGYGDERIGYKLDSAGQNSPAANPVGSAAGVPGLAQPSPANPDADFSSPSGGLEPGPETMAPSPPPPNEAVEPGPTPPAAEPRDAGAASDAGLQTPYPSRDAGRLDAGRGDGGAVPRPIDAGAAEALSIDSLLTLHELPEFEDLPPHEWLQENPFRVTGDMPASTFSIDVDTGSYTLARASILGGMLPARERVRIEEFINYFHLHYAPPKGELPFSVYTELARCPWNADNQLLMVGVQGQEVPLVDQPPANLVYLIDVSGSMNEPHKLPLLKKGFRMLTRQLRAEDTVSIVTYAGAERVVLDGVSGAEKQTIEWAIDDLTAAGSTNGEGGIHRAYALAEEHFMVGGNNRVLLATDGDFNVGTSSVQGLSELVAEKRGTGVYLSVYGFGLPSGNFQDEVAEQLADNGNGIYFFIDSAEEARRAFVHTVTGSLLTVAKDVKLQLQFNPEEVKGYRLVGYENRVLSNADFANDFVDAGELGAGLSVTAFFELIPADSKAAVPVPAPGTDPLEDVASTDEAVELAAVTGTDLVDVRVRYKGRDELSSELIGRSFSASELERDEMSLKFAFASAVAEFAMQLRGSQYLHEQRRLELLRQIELAFPADQDGAVAELYELVEMAYEL